MQKLRQTLVAFFIVTLSIGAFAQELVDILPAETILAFGVIDLAGISEQLEDFFAEAQRLELSQALMALYGASGFEMDDDSILTQGLETSLIGREAWIVLSASRANPLPAVTLAARVSDEVRAEIDGLFDEADADASFSEGAFTFYRLDLDTEPPFESFFYIQADDILLLSTNPDTLRGILRRLAGGTEAGFSDTDAYAATLGELEGGNFIAFMDPSQIAAAASPYLRGLGVDALVTRLVSTLRTLGPSAGIMRVTEAGLENEGIQQVNAEGGDLILYNLITGTATLDLDTVRFAPDDALSFGVNHTDFAGWWNYLNDLARSVPDLGGDLNTLLLTFTGVDLRTTFFDWTGDTLATITTGLGEIAQPGVASDNLLGEVVYLIEATDEEAARVGLQSLFQNVSQMVAMFTSPQGTGSAAMDVQVIEGITVTQYNLGPGLNISYAVTDGYALIATSMSSMQAVLAAQAQGTTLEDEAAFTDFRASLPENVSAFAYSDARATFEALAPQLSEQVQLFAGLGGAAGLDFDAVEEAAEALERFMLFVSSRLGDSVAFTQRMGDTIYNFGETEVIWNE